MRTFNNFLKLVILILFFNCNGPEDILQEEQKTKENSITERQSCGTDVYQSVNLNKTSIIYETRNGKKLYYLDSNNDSYSSALKGEPTVTERIWVSPGGLDGIPAIAFETKPCRDSNGKCNGSSTQKVNFHFLYGQKQGGLEFNTRNYIGFNMNLSGSDIPEDEPGAILFQFWQGSPHSPPFAALMEGSGKPGHVDIVFQTSSDSYGSNPSSSTYEVGRIKNVKYGDWYQFVVGAFPEHDGMAHRTGNRTLEISYKKNSEKDYTNISYYGKWGYDPTGQSGCPYANRCETKLPNRTIDFKFGIYRVATARVRSFAKYTNVKVGKSFRAADPKVICNN